MLVLLGLGAGLAFGIVPVTGWGIKTSRFVEEELSKLDSAAPVNDYLPASSLGGILGEIYPLVIAVSVVACGTSTVVPGVISALTTDNTSWYPGGEWGYQELSLYVFLVFALLGRGLVVFCMNSSPGVILAASVLRLGLVPLLFLASIGYSVLNADLLKFFVIALFGLSDGLLIMVTFVRGVGTQFSSTDATRAGFFLLIALVVGELIGSGVWLGLDQIPKLKLLWSYSGECKIDPRGFAVSCVDKFP